MPEPAQVTSSSDEAKLPPPSGDSQRAEKYVNVLVELISQGKLIVEHTDLSKFDPSSLHDHYRIDMQSYQLEISHSKQPVTGKDSYVMLFNNLKEIEQGYTQKVILAYLILTAEQFKKIQDVADEQIETRKKVEESKRFDQAISQVDLMLEKIAKGQIDLGKTAQALPEIVPDRSDRSELSEKPEVGSTSPSATSSGPSGSPQSQQVSEPTQVSQTDQPAETPPPPPAQPPSPQIVPSLEGYNLPGAPVAKIANPVKIGEVQQILQQEAQNYQQPQARAEALPTIDNLPVSPQAAAPSSAIIDEKIDQAFKPGDNAILSKTPLPNV